MSGGREPRRKAGLLACVLLTKIVCCSDGAWSWPALMNSVPNIKVVVNEKIVSTQ